MGQPERVALLFKLSVHVSCVAELGEPIDVAPPHTCDNAAMEATSHLIIAKRNREMRVLIPKCSLFTILELFTPILRICRNVGRTPLPFGASMFPA